MAHLECEGYGIILDIVKIMLKIRDPCMQCQQSFQLNSVTLFNVKTKSLKNIDDTCLKLRE
jgi:hypothetical protein